MPHPSFLPPSIENRSAWNTLRDSIAPLLAGHTDTHAILETPPVLTGTDFLAARLRNDRSAADHYWQVDRRHLGLLAWNRCIRGVESDDILFNHWYALALCSPTWVSCAHSKDLPAQENPVLDLCSCEMAAFMAEMLEVLEPWTLLYSDTFADVVRTEVIRRVIAPFAGGLEVWWDNESDPTWTNNWSGVCAGSILCACRSLAAQGHPFPAAEQRALRVLNAYLRDAFTPSGECDEGIAYWNYGMMCACLGWSRLSPEELATHVDLPRLRQVASYPERAHLQDKWFYAGNDSGMSARADLSYIPWLARVTDNPWLLRWAADSPTCGLRHLGILMRNQKVDAPAAAPAVPEPIQFLNDQQVLIRRDRDSRGRTLTAILGGGHNQERHNHNDLGHFMLLLDGEWLVPDVGVTPYKADFFGPNRYQYFFACSRGHNCPQINGHEQIPGSEARAQVLEGPTPDGPFTLDLTRAYPVDAGLRLWHRSLRVSPDARAIIHDRFELVPGGAILQRLWSLEKPEPVSDATWRLGPLRLQLSPTPRQTNLHPINADTERLRQWPGRTLYKMEIHYHTDASGTLETMMTFDTE